jgi:hypothetical protein
MAEMEEIRSHIRSLNEEEFVSSLTTICDNLQKQHDILTFGFIIYDETTPQYRKLLRDKDYWEALDRISGDKMMVFALSDKVDSRLEGDNMMHMMTSFTPSRSSKTKSYSHLLNEVFANEARLVYPSVLFFQVFEGNIYNYRLVPLRGGTVEESFAAVQKLFESIAKVLDQIAPENYQNYREIYELVKDDLLNQKYTMYILKGPKVLADFIGVVKNLLFFA